MGMENEITDKLGQWEFNSQKKFFRMNFFWLNGVKSYEIESERISSEMELVGWILHLSEKSWCNAKMIHSLIETVSKEKGWNFYGL